ncbi:hypothetical protein D9756_003217 [Leucocoprinus leucothites]|uniref:Probable acetate kinase n=1 Tax=Leucocoprinus leucothites TaxID=201217 RepID=A0A8H5LJK8_9AGAR|nr:hypothetical protein D9756_003217 [Leucoagaricus leucothites]
MAYILTVNTGSSSLKLSLFVPTENDAQPLVHHLTASITSISSPPATFTVKPAEQAVSTTPEKHDDIHDHSAAFSRFLEFLERDCSIDKSKIGHVCHRVVHGGKYDEPVVVNEKSFSKISRLSDLAPLHNGAALSVIKVCSDALPDAVSVAYFDTIFHKSLPPHIYTYPINPKIAQERGLRKYGFHGISYAYILNAVSTHLSKPPSSLNLILLHLGSGASACCIRSGKSYDTSMGLTPVSGLPGATRSGAIDPNLIFHYTNKANKITHDPSLVVDVPVTLAEDVLNRKSGWKALCGTTDFAEIIDKAELHKGDTEEQKNTYRLAFDIFVDRILNYVGAYFVKLGGEVDALVFSGGIGEKSWQLRKAVSERAKCLGFQSIDDAANKKSGNGAWDIGTGTGKRVLVCETDEQYEMARQLCEAVLKK